jgi:alanine-glyoxylate transaminase/serine-glyoxylate transaminase/serine-pyruvate transaminase
MSPTGGPPLLHTPGPSNVPERILRAMARPTIDHRGPEFAALTLALLPRLQDVFGTSGPVVVYPSSGTGAWEAALVNTLSPGDRVLAFETGHFGTLWARLATSLGLEVDLVPGDWRHGVDPQDVQERLAADRAQAIRAVLVVHNETSTGVRSSVAGVRRAIDAAGHPALLMVDTISSLASMEYRHDGWGADVTVAASQKGLMLPPGLGFNALGPRALAASETARLPRAYWAWGPILAGNADGWFAYTPATNLLFGLVEALDMLDEEGRDAVFRRHERLAAATRAAVEAWGLEVLCADDRSYSSSVTGVLLPDGADAELFHQVALQRYGLALGVGLGKLSGQAFRIGHLGHLGDLGLVAALAGVQLALPAAGVRPEQGGVEAALAVLGSR